MSLPMDNRKKVASGERKRRCDAAVEGKKKKTSRGAKEEGLSKTTETQTRVELIEVPEKIAEEDRRESFREVNEKESMLGDEPGNDVEGPVEDFKIEKEIVSDDGERIDESDEKVFAPEGIDKDDDSDEEVFAIDDVGENDDSDEKVFPIDDVGENDDSDEKVFPIDDVGENDDSDEKVFPIDDVGENDDSDEKVFPIDDVGENDDSDEKESSNKVETEAEKRKYHEYYLNGYCFRNKGSEQYYAKDHLGDEMYWQDSTNTQIYAYKTKEEDSVVQKIEYPATINGEPSYIYERAGKPRYPVNLSNDEIIFPRDPVTDEEIYLLDKGGNLFYPENKYGRQFYRKDAEGNEVVINNMYAQQANGSQIYPTKANGDQFYIEIDNRDVPAIHKFGKIAKPYYAVKANGDEIYPREYVEMEME